MYLPRHVAPLALGLATLITVAASTRSTGPAARAAAAEVTRVRAHFDSVLTELRGRDLGSLSAVQRDRRAMLLTALEAYRARGRFPHNYDFPSRLVPYFVDRKTGALCAVGHLLALTGREDIVRRVVRADNNVYVAQLAGDTALTGWLYNNGLTLGEAERIQIVYAGEPYSSSTATTNVILGTMAVAAGTGSLIASAWNATSNADGHRSFGNALGLTSGIVSTGMGMAILAQPHAPKAIGGVAAAVGGASIALAAHSIWHHSTVLAAERKAERQRAALQASVAPMLAADGSAGLELSIRF